MLSASVAFAVQETEMSMELDGQGIATGSIEARGTRLGHGTALQKEGVT